MDLPRRLLIRNVTAYIDGRLEKTDVLVTGGALAAIGPGLADVDAKVLEAGGCLLSPGFTDLHVHLREPGFERKETIRSGTMAAAAGGFTTVCAMPNLSPVPDSVEHLQEELDAIARDALVRVLPYGAVSEGEKGEELADIEELSSLVCGFSDDGFGLQEEDLARRAMKKISARGGLLAAHCELEEYLPKKRTWQTVQESCRFAKLRGLEGVSNESEWAEVARDIDLCAELAESGRTVRFHVCHASTQKTFELVKKAKEKGLAVSCEVTPHNVLLSCEDITADDGRFKMNPPLRYEGDRRAALAALLDGTADAIATDHAPHTAGEKNGGFRESVNGVVGLETAFPALYTGLVLPGLMPLERLLALLVEGPASVLRQEPGRLLAGETADFTLIDLEGERTVNPEEFFTRGRATPFAGKLLRGWPVLTACGGKMVFNKAF